VLELPPLLERETEFIFRELDRERTVPLIRPRKVALPLREPRRDTVLGILLCGLAVARLRKRDLRLHLTK